MSLKRYYSTQDTTITNAFQDNLRIRGTGSNMGASDILEVFSIYAQQSATSSEASRILVQFPINQVQSDRVAGIIPTSGNVGFFLHLFNAAHPETLPSQFTLTVNPVSRSWQEGTGLDMENYRDLTLNGDGANWIYASNGVQWTNQGGDYLSGTYVPGSTLPHFNQFFNSGGEDLLLDVTPLVEEWITGTAPNYGVGIAITSSQETQNRSFFTKRFFGRTTENFFSQPIIEARWDSSIKDNRGNFAVSSSLLSGLDNMHTIYLYNYYKGQLKNIPDISTGSVFVQVYTSGSDGTLINTVPTVITGGYVSPGIYSASFAMLTQPGIVYDRWFIGSTYYHTGSIRVVPEDASDFKFESQKYVSSLLNLKSSYTPSEIARLRLYSRLKRWNPTIYTVASTALENNIIEDAYYKIFRTVDNYDIVSYGTGSVNHTRLSYDISGSYFDVDMSILQADFQYGIKVLFAIDGKYEEQPETFKFRVENI